MALVAELPVPGALMKRALAIDEAWEEGTIHEFLMTWEAAQGGPGGLARAQQHFERAVALSKGKKLGVLVSYAEAVAVSKQDRAEFTSLLQKVMHADADADGPHRLANVLAQRRARLLLAHADDLFA
jgi:predicted anti-sigma-YlaC factor YlaD